MWTSPLLTYRVSAVTARAWAKPRATSTRGRAVRRPSRGTLAPRDDAPDAPGPVATVSRAHTDDPGHDQAQPHGHSQGHSQGRSDGHSHGHSHGLVDRSIVRSREGVRAVLVSLGVLAVAGAIQVAIFLLSGSVALLADLIHNFGDALTAVPLGIAFLLRSSTGERWAGYAVVITILVSACVALYETIVRLLDPQDLSHLWALAAAGAVGFIGNE